ncbi:MAG TPA: glycosyltransferase family 2 protein [Solirubrobacteraceae bacterium]|nr:glycosyltransferase family 2 protein [Solirubrobacteraceae bacterium]
MTSVAAVVLTRNRRALLAECLDALRAQTHPVARVLVVDNASPDGTAEMLSARADVDVLRLERNAGGAGGFSRGVEAARETEVDWLWLMDDDAEPRPDCLERMLAPPAARAPGTVALCSRVDGADGRLQALHRGFLGRRPVALPEAAYAADTASVGYATFVGLLVRADVARALEPPRAEFFIWADDYEYSLRLSERGDIRLVPASVIVHKDARAAPFLTTRGRLANRLLGWELESTRWDAAWRNLLGVRNYVWTMRELRRQSALGAAATAAGFMVKALLYDERPLRRLPWIWRYAVHGRRGVFDNAIVRRWPP